MSIKKCVAVFWKAIEKDRLKDRSIYLLDQVIKTTHDKLENFRIKHKRLKKDKQGNRPDHFLYDYYIEVNVKCIELKETLTKSFLELESIKNDIDQTHEFGQIHVDRYNHFIGKTKKMETLLDYIEQTFGSWFLLYRMRMGRIRKRFQHHMVSLVKISERVGREVPIEFQQIQPNEDFIFRLNKNQTYPSFIHSQFNNHTIKANMNMTMKAPKANKSKKNLMNTGTPVANTVTVAEKKSHGLHAPMALYYKNSSLLGKRVPMPKTKEYLERILYLFLQFTQHFEVMDTSLKQSKNVYSDTYYTFLGNPPGFLREKSVEALLKSMSLFKKLVQEKETEVKTIDIDENMFDKIMNTIEKGYTDLKNKIENLLNVPKTNVEYESLSKLKVFLLEKDKELDLALKKNVEKDYVESHFPMFAFDKEDTSKNTSKNKTRSRRRSRNVH